MKQMKQARKQRRRSGARSPRIRKAGLDVRVHLLLPLRELELKPRDHRVRQLAGVSEVAVALRRLPQGGGVRQSRAVRQSIVVSAGSSADLGGSRLISADLG